jgi:hypothetical protein
LEGSDGRIKATLLEFLNALLKERLTAWDGLTIRPSCLGAHGPYIQGEDEGQRKCAS